MVGAHTGAALSRHLRRDEVRIKSEIEIRLVAEGQLRKYAAVSAVGSAHFLESDVLF